MNLCGKCFFYEPDENLTARDNSGTKVDAGWCYGAPPSIQGGRIEYPSVRDTQRECALWRGKIPPKPVGRNKR